MLGVQELDLDGIAGTVKASTNESVENKENQLRMMALLQERQRIADGMSGLDACIEATTQKNDTLHREHETTTQSEEEDDAQSEEEDQDPGLVI